MPIGDGSLLRAITGAARKKHPIAAAVVDVLGETMVEAIQSGDPQRVEAAAKKEPAVLNNLNLESPLQSGTTLGMAGALLSGLGAIYAMLSAGNFDPAVLGPIIATVLASGWGLYRRWGSGLKPLFRRKG